MRVLVLILLPFVIAVLIYWLAEDWARGRPIGCMDV
jgi:hypothetical protein